MAPQHLTVHIDNYKTASDLNTLEGQRNLDLIKNADVVYFNGGDQARHVRSWLYDNNSNNALL